MTSLVDRFFNDFAAMHTIWHSLAWKEWHEHKWKLASVTAVLASLPALFLLLEARPYEALFALSIGMQFCVIPVAMFVGLATACGERSQGTLEFLESLPVKRWHAALARLVAGLIVIGVAVLLTVAFLYVGVTAKTIRHSSGVDVNRIATFHEATQLSPFDTGDPYADLALLMFSVGASVFLWTAAAGANRGSIVSAGAVSILAGLGWWLLLLLGSLILVNWHTSVRMAVIAAAISTAPGGIGFVRPAAGLGVTNAIFGITAAVLANLLLAAWYVWRYGRGGRPERVSPRAAADQGAPLIRLAPPRASELTAIVWKQFRESGPLALAGVIVIATIAAVWVAVVASERRFNAADFAEHLVVNSTFMGFLVALVLGVGVMDLDLRSQLNAFWRSRPIDPNLNYWAKFFTGLAILAIVNVIPWCVSLWMAWRDYTGGPGMGDEIMLFFGVQLSVYAIAVGMSCLVRNSIYAGILTIGAVMLAAQTAVFVVWIAIFVFGGRVDQLWLEDRLQAQIAVSGVAIAAIAFALAGWQAFRRDWGWKG